MPFNEKAVGNGGAIELRPRWSGSGLPRRRVCIWTNERVMLCSTRASNELLSSDLQLMLPLEPGPDPNLPQQLTGSPLSHERLAGDRYQHAVRTSPQGDRETRSESPGEAATRSGEVRGNGEQTQRIQTAAQHSRRRRSRDCSATWRS